MSTTRSLTGSAFRLLVPLVAIVLAAQPVQAARRGAKDIPVQQQYELGLRYLKRGYYVKALETFNRIRNFHRDDPLAVKSELAVADVYYRQSEWDQARLAYEDFMRMHPRNEDIDYVVFRIGLSLYRKAPREPARDQTWTRQAVNTWAAFDSRFPASEYRDEVDEHYRECRERLARKEMLIARFYRRRRAWPAVIGRADGLIHAYPNSAVASDGWALLAEADAWEGDSQQVQQALDSLAQVDAARAERLRARLDRIELDQP